MMIKPSFGSIADKSHPLSVGLIGCWMLNEGAGSIVNDLSMMAKYGNMTNFGASEGWIHSQVGHGLLFAANDHIRIATKYIPTDYPISIAVLLNPSSVVQSGTDSYCSICYSDFNSTSRFLNLLLRSSGGGADMLIRSTVKNGSSNSRICDGISVLDNETLTLISSVFYESTSTDVYVNGVFDALSVSSGITFPPNIDIASIGTLAKSSSWVSAAPFNGEIYAVWVWNRVVSEEEFRLLYERPFEMFAPPLYTSPIYGIISSLPARIPVAELLSSNPRYPRNDMQFIIEDIDFIWSNNKLIQMNTGDVKYVLYNQYMVLQ